MRFKNNIKNFIYDLDECITIYDNAIHVFNYEKLEKLNSKEIVLITKKNKLTIIGNMLNIKKMTKQELLIDGNIIRLEFSNE